MLIKMAIADENTEYIERLMNGLEKHNELTIAVYTEKRSLENALATKKIDILLFSPELYNGQISLPKSTLAVLMADDETDIPESCRNFAAIRKYQRISSIYSRLLEMYADVCSNVVVGGGRYTKKVVVYSPIGGVGKTTVALAAATRLAMQGQSVLYLNFEDIASEACYLPQTDSDKGMSELLATLGTDTNMALKLQGLTHEKIPKLYYMNHFTSPNDSYEMRADELEELLNKIANTGLYDYLVIDTETSLADKKRTLFEQADKIVIVNKQDMLAEEKMKCFMRQTHILNEYADRMVVVMNQATQAVPAAQTQLPIVEVISRMQNTDAEKIISSLAAGSLNKLTGILMNI